MKAIAAPRWLVLAGVFLIAAGGFAQEASFIPANGDYYSVLLQGDEAEAEALALRLDAYAALFEDYLHFDRAELPAKLRVRIFDTQNAYTAYLEEFIGTPKDSFVFLQYSDPAKSELVGYNTGSGFESSLIHHAYVQYLKSFIPAPPLWLQKGMAIYLEESRYLPEENRAVYQENLEWLKSLKTYVALDSEIIPVSILLTMDVEAANRQIESFYAQSWGLVHFLLNSGDKDYNRIIWDSLSALEREASRPENESAVIDKGFAWVNKDRFLSDFEEYVNSLMTFPELVQQGIGAYGIGHYNEAKGLFNRALELREDHYIPYYYLGLINYADRDFTMADYFYSQALERGGSEGLIYYAKGISAYSAEDDANALSYLEQVVSIDPAGYGAKAQELIDRIAGEEMTPPAGPEPESAPEDQEELPSEGA